MREQGKTGPKQETEKNVLRRVRGRMSQQEAADLCDVSRQTWAAWEQKTRPIDLEQLESIRRAFELDDAAILEILDWFTTE